MIQPSETGARVPTRTVAVHQARRELFTKGLREGRLKVREIEEALPQGCMTASERWLLYYSLRAAGIELEGEPSELEPPEEEADDAPLPH